MAAAASAASIAAQNTVQSRRAFSASAPSGSDITSSSNPPAASAAPVAPASAPTSSASMISCCNWRWRFAPSAARPAISVARASTCPSISAATLPQAMTRMTITAANVASRLGRSFPTKNSRAGVDRRRLRLVPHRGIRKPLAERVRQRANRHVHVVHRRAVCKAAHERVDAGSVLWPQLRGGPDAGLRTRKPEAARHHADDRARDAANPQLLPQRFQDRIPVPARASGFRPRGRWTNRILGGLKGPSEQGRRARAHQRIRRTPRRQASVSWDCPATPA